MINTLCHNSRDGMSVRKFFSSSESSVVVSVVELGGRMDGTVPGQAAREPCVADSRRKILAIQTVSARLSFGVDRGLRNID